MENKEKNTVKAPENLTFKQKIQNFNTNRVYNKEFFRHGGYAVTVTAIVLAVIILVNFLVGKLSKKVNLEFDMSGNSANTLTAENEEFLKTVTDSVKITVCGTKEDYTNYLLSYSPQLFGVAGDERYFNQTLKFLQKYPIINENITVKFVDVQSTKYTELSQKYANYNLKYGDIIVSCKQMGDEKSKCLSFNNIYEVYDASGYAAYGYDYYTINGNNIENALTGAIAYVTSSENHKVALYTGHSADDYTSAYKALLEANNYEVAVINDAFLSSISDEYDCIALMAPSNDFIEAEIEVLSAFLDNGGKGGRGLIYFADAANPSLPRLNDFLHKWGIIVEDGILLETNEATMPNQNERTALFSVPNESVDYTKNMNGFITGYNVPMSADSEAAEELGVIKVASTPATVVSAPIGVSDDWSGYTENDMKSFDTVIQSKKQIGDKSSYVFALSSIEFINSAWAENTSIANKNLVLSVSDVASGNTANGVSFVKKTIESKDFSASVSEASSKKIRTIFAAIVPIVIIIAGVFVFIKRRNAR